MNNHHIAASLVVQLPINFPLGATNPIVPFKIGTTHSEARHVIVEIYITQHSVTWCYLPLTYGTIPNQ